MRELKHYKTKDWLLFQPIVDVFKDTRNDFYSLVYCKRIPAGHENFLTSLGQQEYSGNIIISIAYNCVETIALLVNAVNKNINNSLLIIADNSSSKTSRKAIKALCEQHQITYFGLPSNKTSHANRSHSLAVQWCYKNIIDSIQPEIFTFLDHDLLPKKAYDFESKISNQAFYGTYWQSKYSNAWQLWAGFCTFRYAEISQYKLNFLYDFANGLDTGGRNYAQLYRHLDKETLNFSSDDRVYFLPNDEQADQEVTLQIIDDCWVHMGGAAHLKDYENRFEVFSKQMKALDQIENWSIYTSSCFTKVESFRNSGRKILKKNAI